MKMKEGIAFAAVCASLLVSTSLNTQNDTLSRSKTTFISNFVSSPAFRTAYIGVPLIAGGLIAKHGDRHFYDLRKDYLPAFRNHADDYLQYLPAVVLLGMKACGVESRSLWKQMLVSDAFSALLMGSVVYTLKNTTHKMRPDNSNDHSFPSGHTATAFMTATMLTKEYGSKTPWIGIGAYSVATATGVMRIANNKHWLSDVLTGAGIGIISTELGYYLANLILKNNGVSPFEEEYLFDRLDNPSFASLYIGMNIPLNDYTTGMGETYEVSTGSTTGIEGAWFFNPYIGVGGRFTISNLTLTDKGESGTNTLDATSICGGSYLSFPISSRFLAGGKILCGYIHYPELQLSDISIRKKDGFCFGSGISMTFRATEYYGLKLFLDYNLQPSPGESNQLMNTLAVGSSFAITF